VTYQATSRLRPEFVGPSLVAARLQASVIVPPLCGNQHVVHVQGLAVALGGAAQQRTRVIVVSQGMVKFHGIRAVRKLELFGR
jgi:hypothetical protein